MQPREYNLAMIIMEFCKNTCSYYVEEKIVKYNGGVQIKKYMRGKFLGKGGFAKCYEIIN